LSICGKCSKHHLIDVETTTCQSATKGSICHTAALFQSFPPPLSFSWCCAWHLSTCLSFK